MSVDKHDEAGFGFLTVEGMRAESRYCSCSCTRTTSVLQHYWFQDAASTPASIHTDPGNCACLKAENTLACRMGPK